MIKYLLILFVSTIYGQQINKATYIVSLNKPKGYSGNLKNENAKKLIENAKNIKLNLFFNKEESLFFKEDKMQNDFEKNKLNLTEILVGAKKKYYTSYGDTEDFFIQKNQKEIIFL